MRRTTDTPQADRAEAAELELRAARMAVRVRAGDRCEVQTPGCESIHPHYGSDCHHVWPEDRQAKRHDPDRLLWLCAAAHRWTHANPEAARDLGTLRPRPKAPDYADD